MVQYATQATKRYQWETSSLYSQSWNCGPTCATFVASYYRGVWYGIEATRRLVTTPQTSTDANQQRDMLIKRGVPATVRHLNSIEELHGLVDSNRRPVIVGMQMNRVPLVYRDHPFGGWHAVVVMAGGSLDGTRGFWINDPNFSPVGGIRPDPDRGMKWYPDWLMNTAWAANYPRWCVVPNSAKPLPAPTVPKGRAHVKGPDINIRSSMSTATSANIYARSRTDGYTYRYSDGVRLWKNTSVYILLGFSTVGGVSWAKLQTGSGMKLFCYQSLMNITVWP